MSNPILRITDGTDTVDLLSTSSGIVLEDWNPSIAQLKAGGIYRQSVMSDGKQLVMSHFDNAIETFTLKAHSGNQDRTIYHTQELFRLLEKARSYWTLAYPIDPVYIEARAPKETNTRYAIVHNYSMSNLDNPYATPFFACDPSTMDELTLVVERGHWQNVVPTTGECVAITGGSSGLLSAALPKPEVAANADDFWATLGASGHTATGLFTGTQNIVVGRSSSGATRYGFSVRFPSASIPDGATVTNAYISLESSWYKATPTGSPDRTIRVYGDDADDSAQITNLADWNARSLTTEYATWVAPTFPVGLGSWHDTSNIANVINEIIERPGWSPGNALHFFVEEHDCDADVYYNYAAYEHPTRDPAKLTVEYTFDAGENTATCEAKVFATTKYRQAPLTHIYVDNGGVWGSNLIGSTAYNLLPATPAVNDAVYFGNSSTFADQSGPFNNLIFDIGTAQSGCTIVWEYYQGAPTSAWSALGSYAQDTTQSFTNEGIGSMTFLQIYDSTNGSWTTRNISSDGGPSISGYWVRARVTGISSPTAPAQQNQAVYSVSWPFIGFESDGVVGDIPAIARIELDASGNLGDSVHKQHRLIAALQSNRGPYGDKTSYDFSAYFPLADEQLPSLMGTPVVAGDFSFASDIMTSTGRAVLLNPSGTGEKNFYFTANSLHFYGRYRAFLRVRQQSGSDNDFACRLEILDQPGGVTQAATKDVSVTIQSGTTNKSVQPFWQLLDLGTVSVPAGGNSVASSEGGSMYFYIVTTVSDATGDLYFHDLILMPADEWIVDAQDMAEDGWHWSEKLLIDSITVPKIDVRSLTKWDSESSADPRTWKTVGSQMRLPANTGGKIWILTAQKASTGEWLSDGHMVTGVRLFSAEQYLGLRGSR